MVQYQMTSEILTLPPERKVLLDRRPVNRQLARTVVVPVEDTHTHTRTHSGLLYKRWVLTVKVSPHPWFWFPPTVSIR